MLYLSATQNKSGAYPAPQSNYVPGLLELPDELLETFLEYNGFVNLTVEGETITAIEPNTDTWETWKAEQSALPVVEPEPSTTDILNTLLGVSE